METTNIIRSRGNSVLGEGERDIKDEVREICLNIFLNFAKVGRGDDFILPYMELTKLLKLAGIVGKEGVLRQSDIDILLKTINPGLTLTSEQFLNFVVQLSGRLHQDDFQSNGKEYIIHTVRTYFYPLYTQITEGVRYYATNDIQKKITETQFDDNTMFILGNIQTGLVNIYKAYFFYENCSNFHEEIKTFSLKDLMRFCKDFLLIPISATMEKVGIMYHMLSEMKQEEITKNGHMFEEQNDIGVFYKLSHFAATLVFLAILSFERYDKYLEIQGKDVQIDNFDIPSRLILFLHKLQTSQGFDKLRINKPFTSKMYILPPKDIIEKVMALFIH
jgi:hypothetical protein